MNHCHRLDAMAAVLGKARFEIGGVDAVAPIAGDIVDIEAEALGKVAPQHAEVPGLVHQDAVAG